MLLALVYFLALSILPLRCDMWLAPPRQPGGYDEVAIRSSSRMIFVGRCRVLPDLPGPLAAPGKTHLRLWTGAKRLPVLASGAPSRCNQDRKCPDCVGGAAVCPEHIRFKLTNAANTLQRAFRYR